MFSGRGIYHDGLIFALALRGELFLKVDSETEREFRAAGSSPFTYARKGSSKVVALSYWRLPELAVDDPEEIARWARLAVEAAQRAAPMRKTRQTGKGTGRGVRPNRRG